MHLTIAVRYSFDRGMPPEISGGSGQESVARSAPGPVQPSGGPACAWP
ncbi:hypothetical protein [Nonomuraea dietziae]